MFPFDIDDEDLDLLEEDTSIDQIPTDYEIDFSTGELTGRVISGQDAIVQWAKMALTIDRYNFNQYSWSYGCELSSLIGKGYDPDLIESESKRMIEEALIIGSNPSKISIEDFSASVEDDKLTASFTLKSIYGEETVNV